MHFKELFTREYVNLSFHEKRKEQTKKEFEMKFSLMHFLSEYFLLAVFLMLDDDTASASTVYTLHIQNQSQPTIRVLKYRIEQAKGRREFMKKMRT